MALATGANRGFGAAFCRVLLERGATNVYAGPRQPATVAAHGVVPVPLDITTQSDVAAAAARCGDVTLLVNNAGNGRARPRRNGDGATRVRDERARTAGDEPCVRARPRGERCGAIINVSSVLSRFSMPGTATYCASKAASWSLTNSLRQELLAQHTQVLAFAYALAVPPESARRLAAAVAEKTSVVRFPWSGYLARVVVTICSAEDADAAAPAKLRM